MAINRPKTYQNFVPPASGKSYQIAANADGTSKIEDVTQYEVEGDSWSAADANAVWDQFENLNADDVGARPSDWNPSASDIKEGTLPPERGGTGQTSLQAARNAMGLGNTTGVLPVANGGTGQNTLNLAVGTQGARAIYAGTSDMTAGTTALTTGVVYFVYE